MRTWTAQATIGAVSISSRLTGQVQVSAEENQARTATLTFLPAAGTYNPEDWIGKAVTISYVVNPDGGATVTRIFTGFVNVPELDEVTGLLTLRCSDLLQNHYEALDDAGILAAIPGSRLHDAVFGEREDGWQRAQDALSTVRAETHKDRLGSVVVTDWAAKMTADYSFPLASQVYGTPRVNYAQKRELINSISVSYQYRFNRFKIRTHGFGWSGWQSTFGPKSFCDWISDNNPLLPTREMIESAASGAGWPLVLPINYGRLPPPGTYDCGSGPITWIGVREEGVSSSDPSAQQDANQNWATGASWSARKRWAQTITEEYDLTVSSAGSIALFGEAVGEEGAGHETEADDSGWESSTDTSIPAGYVPDAIGDSVQDQLDRADSNACVECLLQVADVRIAGSHRRNYVEWDTPLLPTIDLEHTAEIVAGRINAKGKVAQIQHTMDLGTGQAVTGVRIACSRGGGGTGDALSAPSPPDTSPTHPAPPSSTSLTTYLGGFGSAPDWSDPGGSYVSTNMSAPPSGDPITDPDNQVYPRRVQVVGPDIETEARDAVEAQHVQVYDVAVPDDTLMVTL